MNFFDHIEELRVRLFRCAFVFFIGFMICYFVATDWVMDFLRQPLFQVMDPDKQKLYFTSLFENFLTHLKIAGYCSVFLFSPYYFAELWGFISPGLYEREKKYVVPFILIATIFFLGGAAFAYWVLFPVGFKFFITFGTEAEVPLLTIDAYYSTCLRLLFLFGVAFELPVLVVLLGFLGVIDAETLRKHRKSAILGITVASALFAPPDAISMLMLMAPLILFYEAAIVVVQWVGRRRSTETTK